MVIYDKITISGIQFLQSTDMKVISTMSENNSSSTCSVTCKNYFGSNKDVAIPGDEIMIYAEKDVNPPTKKIFTGQVTSMAYGEQSNKGTIVIEGRDYYGVLQDATIPPIVYRNLDAGSIVKHLVDTNTSGLNTGSINVATGNLIDYKRYNHLHVADAIKELGEETGYYSYVNTEKYVMFEPKNTVTAGFTIGSHNTLQSNFKTTTDDMSNEVYVYGDRVLTAAPTITQTSDGAGSTIQLAFKP